MIYQWTNITTAVESSLYKNENEDDAKMPISSLYKNVKEDDAKMPMELASGSKQLLVPP